MPKRRSATHKIHFLEPRTSKQYETQRRVLDALSLKRRNPKRSLTAAAKSVGTTIPTIRRHAPSALEVRSGRIDVKAVDRIPRRLKFLTDSGEITIVVRNSRDATRISKHHEAIKHALLTFGFDRKALERFKDKTLRAGGQTYTFVTDYRTIIRLARAGEVHFLDIYAPASAA